MLRLVYIFHHIPGTFNAYEYHYASFLFVCVFRPGYGSVMAPPSRVSAADSRQSLGV
jgi:hypothetical protein